MARRSPEERQAADDAVRLRRVSDEMVKLESRIDRAAMGSRERLTLLRKQASLSDVRQSLRDRRF